MAPSASDRETTRNRLLGAGVEVLRSNPGALLFSGLTVEMIGARSGLSLQTFYKQFPKKSAGGKSGYLDELLASLPVGPPRFDANGPAASRSHDWGANRREFAIHLFHVLVGSSDAEMRRIARVLGLGSPRLSSRVRLAYQTADALIAEEVRILMRSSGVPRLRQPFTYDSVAALLIALAEGFDLRAPYDPATKDTKDVFVNAASALLAGVADTEDRHAHIDDTSSPTKQPVSTARRSPVAERFPDDAEQAVIEAAALEFSQRGYFVSTQEIVARRAGLPLGALQALFPSNVDIVVAALAPTINILRRRTETDLRLGREPLDVISSFPGRMAEQIIANRSFFDAMALVLSLHGAQAQVDATHIREELFFPGTIAECIAEGQRRGQVTDALNAVDLAVTLTNNIIFRCLSRRDETAEEVADAINRMFLPVLFATGEPQADAPDFDGKPA